MQGHDINIGKNSKRMCADILAVTEKGEIKARLGEAVGRAAKKMGVTIEEKSIAQLGGYAEELQRWNKAYNLVGRNIGPEGLVSLYVDAISPLCIKGLLEEGREVLDIGSGAGLPGIPLYMAAGPFPLVLVESQRKKISFLRHIRRRFSLENVGVYPGRFEEMVKSEDHLSSYDVGLARAVMEPLRLVHLACPLICEGGRLVIFVGKSDGERLRRARLSLEDKGMRIEAIRSTRRIVGKEHFLAVIRKKNR